jgi:hypothetical protein
LWGAEFCGAPTLFALLFLIPLTTGGPNMEQQRILLINFGTELARLTTDILGENNFEVQSVENPEKMNTTSLKKNSPQAWSTVQVAIIPMNRKLFR